MPTDKSGKYRPNNQLAAHADKVAEGRNSKPAPAMGAKKFMGDKTGDKMSDKPMAPSGGEHSELHAHGDGTYHTMDGGQKTEHPSLGHALMHMAGKHEPDGTHVHMHHDGMGVKSHMVRDGGQPEGPMDHESGQEAGAHAAQMMDGDGGYNEMPAGEPDGDEGMGMSGMRRMMGM